MWRIYTNQETLAYLAKEHNVHTVCGPDMEVYVCDPMFSRIIPYLAAIPPNFSDFSAEFVPDSDYDALCQSAGLIP